MKNRLNKWNLTNGGSLRDIVECAGASLGLAAATVV